MSEAKPYAISKQVVWEAYLKVKANHGAAGVDEQEQVILRLAAGAMKRDDFVAWVQAHLRQRPADPGTSADGPRD